MTNPDNRTFVADLPRLVGERVSLCGWLTSARKTKSLRFLVVHDRTGTTQAVVRDEDKARELDSLTAGSALRVVGVVRTCNAPRFGPVEVEVEGVDVLARADSPLPLDGVTDPDTRIDHRHLDLRRPEVALIFDVRSTLVTAAREWLLGQRFLEIQTPKITAGGSESGAAVFKLDYFGETACLVQSPQFYVQMAMAGGLDRVFELGPVFRAEPAVTNRHAAEFTCLDVEISWIESHHQLMDLEEALLRHALGAVRDRHSADIERLCGVPVEVPEGPIPRMTHAEAAALTSGVGARLTHGAEEQLCKRSRELHGHSFVFVSDYPAADRPFYTMRSETPDTSRSFDLLWRGTEITSGCQREHRSDRLRAQAGDAGLHAQALAGYLDRFYLQMFRYGCPPHGGFGIGLERLLMALLAQPSIRETSFVFRGPGRFVP